MLKNNVQKDWQGLMRSIRRCLACMHRSPSRQSLHKLVMIFMILSKVDWWIVHNALPNFAIMVMLSMTYS